MNVVKFKNSPLYLFFLLDYPFWNVPTKDQQAMLI